MAKFLKIEKKDALNTGREKLNNAIDGSEESVNRSIDADNKATQALAKSESTQTQLDTIVIDGDSSVEAAQARVDEKGVAHDTLKKRIDDGFEKTSSQLAKTATKESVANDIERATSTKAEQDYVDEKFSFIGSASPKGAYTTLNELKNTHPNGDSGIYVVSDNGNWYYWNDLDWVVGGVYQSEVLADKSIKPIHLSDNLTNELYENILPYASFEIGSLSSTSGNPVSNDGRIRSDFIYVPKGFITFKDDGLKQYAIFIYGEMDKEFISSSSFLSDYYEIPNNCFVKVIVRKRDDSTISPNEIEELSSHVSLYIDQKVSGIKPNNTTFFSKGKNLFDKDAAIEGKYIRSNDGNLGDSVAYYASDWIEVEPNTTYSVSNGYQLAFYDKFKNYITGRSADDSTTFQTPEKAFYIRTSIHMNALNSFQLEKGNATSFESYKGMHIPEMYLPINQLSKNKLYGLKWGVIGDSISTLNYRAEGLEYPGRIALNNNMVLNNLAVPGSMITKSSLSGQEDTHMSERVLELNSNCDVVTVMGGVNDLRNNRPLGTMGDTDITTFYGALDKLCRNMITKFPGKPKAIFTPIKFRGHNEDLKPYVQAIKEVAAKYAIHVLDLFNICDLQPDIDFINEIYFYNSDGLHPNVEGHIILSRTIENFLMNLV